MGIVIALFYGVFTYLQERLSPRREESAEVRWVSVASRVLVVLLTLLINGFSSTGFTSALADLGISTVNAVINYPAIALFTTFPLTIVSVATGSVLMMLVARRDHRRHSIRLLSRPLRSIFITVALPIGWAVLSIGAVGLDVRLWNTQALGPLSSFLAFVIFIPLVIACLTIFLAIVAAVVVDLPATMFAARDAHPGLPAVSSIVLLCISTAIQISFVARFGWSDGQPRWAQVLVLTLAPVAGWAVAAYEIAWLRRQGVRMRLPFVLGTAQHARW